MLEFNFLSIRLLLFLILTTVSLSCKVDLSSNSAEEFPTFFDNWCSDEEFQLSRINFPLEYTYLDGDFNEVTTFLEWNDWEKTNCFFNNSTDARPQFYDSFSHSLRDTDERVFAWHGVGTGEEIYYYFKRIKGKWVLVRFEDIGT